MSRDAIEKVQINLVPYYVRKGGFTGVSVNSVTKSGTYQFRGSVYMYYRNQDLVGNKVGYRKLEVTDSYTRTIGATLGGPILQDKLFFFISVEQDEAVYPGDNLMSLRTYKYTAD